MSKGRKPLEAAAMQGDVYDADKLAAHDQQLAVMGEVQATYGAERDLVNQMLGQAQIARASADFLRQVGVAKIAHVRESKAYKALAGMKNSDGGVCTGTFDEFCELLGISPSKAHEDIQNLQAFGEQALEAMSRAGIGYRQLRVLRNESFAEEDRATLIEAAKAGDKDKLLDVAEDLIARQRVKEDRQKAQLDKLEASNSTLSKDLEKTRQDLDKAKAKAALIPRLTPDKKAGQMLSELEDVYAEARAQLRHVASSVDTLLQYAQDNGLDFDEDVGARTVELGNLLLGLIGDLRVRGIHAPAEHALLVLGGKA